METIKIQPVMFRWARERAGLDMLALNNRFPKLPLWEAGEAEPTLNQLERFAAATYAPIGYFFLPEPPIEPLPIPDFRTVGDRPIARISANLLDTIYICQQRQTWYQENAIVSQIPPCTFVGSASLQTPVEQAATNISTLLGFSVEARRDCPSWTEALRLFIEQVEALGVMVMVSGVVMNNNTRHLDPAEFRGFVLCDALAPLIFINGADSKAAQMFTLAHELAHLLLGESGLSDAEMSTLPQRGIETWCNQVAAELLVPMQSLLAVLDEHESLFDTMQRLARHFKVSSLVILRRLLDAGRIDLDRFYSSYRAEVTRINMLNARNTGGGNFYRTTAARVSRRFASALVESTLEGRTLYRDAFQMLGISKTSTFNEFSRTMGYPA
jgi:Zn-dependent peptidase ImmA (M78 family)/transcriptional regulator with XRE-family HTH domain